MLPKDNKLNDAKSHALPAKKEKVLTPLHANVNSETKIISDESALNLIREKLNTIYLDEPDAKKELQEDSVHRGHRSKHQQFMHELSSSGKSLADIQTAWHDYYSSLPDAEKHVVWQEFYANYNNQTIKQKVQQAPARPYVAPQPPANIPTYSKPKRTTAEIKEKILSNAGRTKPKNHHLASLKFGILSGVFVLMVMMFGFFNERFLVPFIRPSHAISATPLILDTGEKVGPEPKLIIPKINVEAPVVYDQKSIEESAVQDALEDGVLHYATTPNPGEFGNSVIFGHSSNNIFNKGAYKYVFVQLNKLEIGDTFYIHKNGVRYVYKIYEKKIVTPQEVSVLDSTAKDATMTLITCDPPGTAINRLVVIGEQITPAASANTKSTVATKATAEPEILPSNAPSLWSRFTSWLL